MSITLSNINLKNITVGDAPADPYYGDVVLLLHFDGTNGSTTFTDSGPLGKVPLTVTSPVSIINGQGMFDGAGNFTGGYIRYADSPDWDFGSGDWTVECFANFNSASASSRLSILGQANASGGNYPFAFIKQTSGQITFAGTFTNSSQYIVTSSNTVSINTWYHIAGVRSGTNFSLWVNGTLWGSITSSALAVYNPPNLLGIGVAGEYAYSYGGVYGTIMMGLLDEVRLTRGIARYTAPFDVPTEPFPNY